MDINLRVIYFHLFIIFHDIFEHTNIKNYKGDYINSNFFYESFASLLYCKEPIRLIGSLVWTME